MSSKGLAKIREAIEHDDTRGRVRVASPGMKLCPSCSREFPKEMSLVVCKFDGTLLIPAREVANVINDEVKGSFADRRYQMDHFVGEGDLTRVYFAKDMKSWTEVVIKVIKPHMMGTSKRIRRFADSLHETISLQHPGIVSVLDSGIAQGAKGSVPQVYFVVEKLKASKSLKSILHQTGPMSPYVVIETMVKACEILDYAATNGWIHKDIKPSNIFISLEGEQVSVKISDFGVAERMFRNLEWESNATKTTSIYGNAGYISPEVAFGVGGSEHTVASDIYSLGCTMYHVLKGMQPFEGNNDFDTLMQHMGKEPKPFADELRIPKELEVVVMRCLAKHPEERFRDFGALGLALNVIR